MASSFYCRSMGFVETCQTYLQPYEDNILLLSRVGDPRNTFLVLFPLTYCFHKQLGLKVLWASAFTEWLNALLKWLARDDRPYWWHGNECKHLSEHLRQFPITCETGPGFPSGHVMAISSLALVIILHFYNYVRTKSMKNLFLLITVTFFLMLVILVSISRVYTASHFPHQVFAGAVIGILLAFLLNFFASQYFFSILFHFSATMTGVTMLALAYALCHLLLYIGVNPSATIKLALKYCQIREFVNLDTTLFFAVTRDAGCLCGLGFTSLVFSKFGPVEEFMASKKPFYRLSNLASALIVCPIAFYVSSFSVSHEDLVVFYAYVFLKFFLLPVNVVAVKRGLECIFNYLPARKWKEK